MSEIMAAVGASWLTFLFIVAAIAIYDVMADLLVAGVKLVR